MMFMIMVTTGVESGLYYTQSDHNLSGQQPADIHLHHQRVRDLIGLLNKAELSSSPVTVWLIECECERTGQHRKSDLDLGK